MSNGSSNSREDFADRLNRLLERLMQGTVVPFVGAGISFRARLGNEYDTPVEQITVSPLTSSLVQRLASAVLNTTDWKGMSWNTIRSFLGLAAARSSQDEVLGTMPSLEEMTAGNQLGRLAEIVDWLYGPGYACTVLELHRFPELEPCPAHRYLAYLAREGILGEIITTNYDTCLEKAYRQSFGDNGYILGVGRLPHPPSVICDLQSHRRHGGVRFHSGLPKQPKLRIYKINGCARNYYTCSEEGSTPCRCLEPGKPRPTADGIILTERQLQRFRDRQWAKDLLKDRARSRSFLFNGFGSDEPQIRHNVLALVEEFQHDTSRKLTELDGAVSIAELPNAPYVVQYSPELTFSQCQVLFGYYSAHIEETNQQKALEMMLAARHLSTFTGNDCHRFDRSNQNSMKLPADLFWARIFQAVFRRLVEEQTGPGSLLESWLEQYGLRARKMRRLLLGWLYPGWSNPNQHFEALFGRCTTLFEPRTQHPSEPLLLWRWLWRMMYPADSELPSDWNLPLWINPLYILATLLLMRVLLVNEGSSEIFPPCPEGPYTGRIREIYGLGLQIFLEGNESGSVPCVYLVHEAAAIPYVLPSLPNAQDDRVPQPPPRISRLIVQIAVPTVSYLDWESRCQIVVRNHHLPGKASVDDIWVGLTVRVPAGDFLARIGKRQGNIQAALKDILPRRPKRRGAKLQDLRGGPSSDES